VALPWFLQVGGGGRREKKNAIEKKGAQKGTLAFIYFFQKFLKR